MSELEKDLQLQRPMVARRWLKLLLAAVSLGGLVYGWIFYMAPGIRLEAAKKAEAAKMAEAAKKLNDEKIAAAPDRIAKNANGGRRADGAVGVSGPLNDYFALVAHVLKANWIRPPDSLLDPALPEPLVDCIITIGPDGQVVSFEFLKQSGQDNFDLSVERAIKKSRFAPFSPELMKVTGGQPLKWGIYFTPSGIKDRRS